MPLIIFEIPEVIDLIAANLLTKHLRECLLVSKTWYNDFLPHLWRDVAVLDFDMVHLEEEFFNDYQCPDRNLGDGDCRGHAMAHKYSHFIRSMATQSTRSLMDLGPGCVKLERLCLGQTESERFISTPDSTTGHVIWLENEEEYKHQFDQTVLSLLRRNLRLRVIKGVPMTGRPFLEALGNLKHLEELWFKGPLISETLQNCGAKLKVLCALGENDDRFDGICARSWDDGVDLNVDRPQPAAAMIDCPWLEDLSFSSVGQMKLFFEKVKSPCPALRTLRVLIRKQSEVEVLERLIVKTCRAIEDLTLSSFGYLAGLDRIVAAISKLQSLVIKGSIPDLPLIQAIEKHHRESLQVVECLMPSGHKWVSVQLAAGVADALAHLQRRIKKCESRP